MVISIIIGIVVLVIAFVIYREYKNEKRYQEERAQEQERKKRKIEPKVTTRPSQSRPMPQETPSTKEKPKEPAPQPKQESRPAQPAQAPKSEPTPKKEVSTAAPKATTPPPSKPAVEEKEIELPKGEYPEFNYSRLKEMGLSEEEALEFIQELIPQIGDQIPLLDEAMAIPDFHQMERLTHSIKGSSTTIGTGGVSDLLVDYNTYLKTGDEVKVAEAYQAHLKRYYELLKKQFPKES